MDDFLVDAILQFIKGRSWLDPIEEFQKDHCEKFREDRDAKQASSDDYTQEQYMIFQQFQELVDGLLQSIIKDLGCDPEAFLQSLETKVHQAPDGPKDEQANELIETLLSYDDFKAFHSNMIYYNHTRNVSQEQMHSTSSAADPLQHDLFSTEWLLQEAMAKSLLEANAQGQLDETEIELIPWAEAIMEMKKLADEEAAAGQQYDQEGEYAEADPQMAQCHDRMRELEATLAKERLKVDLIVAQRMSEANAELRKQMFSQEYEADELGDIAGDEELSSEDEVMQLLGRVEELRTEVEEAKGRCFAYENISQQAMEEMYLFLKEKIHHKYDLSICQDEIYDYIFARIYQEDSGIIPDLLHWLMLETESLDSQKRINEILNGPTEETPDANECWMELWDDASESYYYFNTINEESLWEKPAKYWGADEMWHSLEEEQQKIELEQEAQQNAEAKGSELNTLGEALEQALALDSNVEDMEKELKRISDEHEKEKCRLEVTLQVEQARQRQEIKRRKEKRRREKAKKKAEQEAKQEQEAKGGKEDEISTEEKVAMPKQLKPLEGAPKIQPLSNWKKLPALQGKNGIDITSLLTKADALRHQTTPGGNEDTVIADAKTPRLQQHLANPNATVLNANSLRFLAEKTVVRESKQAW